jgi:hypothetical protein
MSTRRDVLTKRLGWMPKVWLAAREALRQDDGVAAVTFQHVPPECLRLRRYLRDIEGIEYFSVTYGGCVVDGNRSMSAVNLDRRINETDLVRGSCRISAYTIWHLMVRIMCKDATLNSVEWKRCNPYPELILFDAGEDVQPYNHD